MSVTKSIASLAVGRMLRDGQLTSVDTALHWFFPEWRQGRKRQVTLRHVLAHTTGLQDVPNAGQEIEPSPDVVRLALAAELVSDPGSTFAYNNKAANLLSAVVERVTGTDIERYLEQTVFADLGIGDVRWIRDPAGTPYTMAGLHLSVRDLARIGQMLIDGGRANGRQVIDSAYAQEAFRPQQPSPPVPRWRAIRASSSTRASRPMARWVRRATATTTPSSAAEPRAR
jgi:CubicO group peptidase (beta-lactamase class C family)